MSAPTFGANGSPTMEYVDSDIHDDDAMFGDVSFDASGEPLGDHDVYDSGAEEPTPLDEFLTADEPDIDPKLVKPRPRGVKARQYERKTAGLLSTAIKMTVQSERTIADSATLLLYGPHLAEKVGDCAADNAAVARMIDMITDQTENPTVAAMMAAAPVVLQIMRNHEREVTETKTRLTRSIRVPFTKREVTLRFRIRLPKRMRNLTKEPTQLVGRVFTNPEIVAALKKQGINIVSQ